ncbi:hypothetical protein [Gemmatimonas sp. UBA7669]|uniref:hypothetical protein n=1 Tax=Gemmatimonas sp. UBA7669 TaxID=1946568 RepID=UPI0025C74071|nr:hypothetical protein [Gemmatimonas sp. UBA7669]
MTTTRAGTPGPDRWIRHESIDTAGKKVENVAALYAGASCTNGVPLSALVVCAGASRGRVRFKSTAAGTLKLEFVRPLNSPSVVPYGAGNPTPVAVTANVETLLTTPDIAGEASALITFTPSGAGTVNFVDWMAL